MPSHRINRNAEDIKRELTAILRDLKDPRLHDSLISVVRVEVTNDMSFCKIYISSIDGIENAKEAVKVLKKATGHIRHELANRVDIRHVPSPLFYATDSIEYGTNISKLLNNLEDNKNGE